MRKLKNIIPGIFCLLGLMMMSFGQDLPRGITVEKIWDQGGHNAFTDLIRFKGKFYCSFREGDGHVPKNGVNGKVRIVRSANGRDWESVALLEKPGIDLRDPKLSVTPSGEIMVIIGGSVYAGSTLKGRVPQVSFSDKKGNAFSDPEKVSIDPDIVSWGDWIWRVTWHKGVGYAIDYQVGPEERRGPVALYLLKTTDGLHFSKVYQFDIDGFPNEATVRFDGKDSMHVLIRRELGDQMGVLAVAASPYLDWNFHKLDYRLGGPNFVFLKNDQRIIGTRVHVPEVHLGLLGEIQGYSFKEILRLPSSGDCSYPGMLVKGKKLYLSYYSSHEGKTSIYFAGIPLSLLE
ncbi:MAG: hypothetical protein M9933_13750 [Chitinophagaceae bacterium]|nr:hypothetical protein [Chitinophagaceae bacterium]